MFFPEPGKHVVEAILPEDSVTADNRRWCVVEFPEHEVFWSDEMFEILGFPVSKITPALEGVALFTPESLEKVDAAMQKCITDGTPIDLELEIHNKSGRLLTVRCRGEVERDAHGNVVRLSGAFQDITELRRIEKEGQRLAARLTATLENMPDPFYLLDDDWKFIYLNDEATRILKRSAQDLIGKSVWAEFPELLATELHDQFQCANRDKEPDLFQFFFPPLEHWFEVSVYPSADGMAVYFKVITERLALEEQLRQSQRLDSVGQLTGGVAHDFNNLLTVIMGNAELLVDELPDSDDRKSLAETILNAAIGGADLIQRLLSFARRQALDPVPVNANDLIVRMNKLLRRSLGEHIEIDFIGGENLWQALADPSRLESAVLNLCINARDAMPHGGNLTIETQNVTIAQDYAEQHVEFQPGNYVIIAVSDTGAGIKPEHMQRVFEPFFTTKGPGKGTGLGLSMVYGFVKQSNGHITIYSEPGEGTTVKLFLPQIVDANAKDVNIEDPTVLPLGAEKILLVEDNDLVRQYSSSQLSALGYDVVETSSGPEALELLQKRDDFDLLFTDIVMPGGMNGRQLADAARELHPQLLVLYTSGYTDNAIVHHGRLDPGAHLLNKPYGRAELARKIREVLDL